jgi:DNA mismatch endonuclease (patch repair protein)
MADFMSPSQRSAHMSKIHSKNTKPEPKLRQLLHAEGYRYRIHLKTLPGSPDLVFPGRRKVIGDHSFSARGTRPEAGSSRRVPREYQSPATEPR